MVNTLFYIQFTIAGQVSLVFLIRVRNQLKMDGFHRRAPSYFIFKVCVSKRNRLSKVLLY